MQVGLLPLGTAHGVSLLLLSHAALVPLRALGSVEFTLATLPLISNQYIELNINVSAHQGGHLLQGAVWVSRKAEVEGGGLTITGEQPETPCALSCAPAVHREECNW